MSASGAGHIGDVQWEILPGLPGEGPISKHFHHGHPTPWREGHIIRFRNADGSEWIGNFQTSSSSRPVVLGWPEADAVAVITDGDFYLISIRNPDDYLTLGPQSIIAGAVLNESRDKLFVAELFSIIAYGRDRKPLWRADGLGGEVVAVRCVNDDVLSVCVEEELGEPCATVLISAQSGVCLA